MGAGKSRVGRTLAQKLGLTFIDTDALIEKEAGRSIPEIFKEGEEAFRKLEEKVVSSVATGTNQVIALGGGALLKATSLSKVLQNGMLIYLRATPETLSKRLERSHRRPVLESQKGASSLQVIEKILSEREVIYRSAHHTIVTDGKNIESIAAEILKLVKA